MAKKSNIEVQNWNVAKPVVNNASPLNSSPESIIRQISNENTARTFDYNTSEAQKARDFQEYMSNTSHQREVADLKAAGLNPVLSANGGAQAYSAASASGSADSSSVGALASLYATKMNNDNAVKIAEMSNKNSKEIAKINAAANMYASENSYSASKYATDHSKYGIIDQFVSGMLGNGTSGNSASKIGNAIGSLTKSLVKKFKK